MRIIPIVVPTPFYVGPVNCYLVAEDPVTLIDTGPKTKEALEALKEGLRKARFRVSDLRRIVLTPGHTPGSCSFLREADRTLIAGDCVLKRITPNPILSPDPLDPARRFRSLAEYLVSLARLRGLHPTLVYGGHGEPVSDYEELFNRYLRAIGERQTEVIRLIPKQGATAWDISLELFPGSTDVHRFLAVSEAVAHLDLAHSEGKLALELSGDGSEVYRRA